MDLYNAYKSKNNNNKDKDVKFYSRYISKRNFEKDNFFQKTKVIASISIPKLGLYNIDIVEGVSEKVLDSSIGHFESTSLKNGNIGLAAHNRGYNVNYFANIHKLENGDLIEYSIDGEKFQYFVNLKEYISSYDWEYLEPTNENKITLITCVDNRPKERLCVQAKCSKEGK